MQLMTKSVNVSPPAFEELKKLYATSPFITVSSYNLLSATLVALNKRLRTPFAPCAVLRLGHMLTHRRALNRLLSHGARYAPLQHAKIRGQALRFVVKSWVS